MRLERSERVPIFQGGKSRSVLRSLFEPFGEVKEEGRKFELRAELGQLVIPLYKEGEGFGPAFEERKGWKESRDWLEKRGKNELVWIPSYVSHFLISSLVCSRLIVWNRK